MKSPVVWTMLMVLSFIYPRDEEEEEEEEIIFPSMVSLEKIAASSLS